MSPGSVETVARFYWTPACSRPCADEFFLLLPPGSRNSLILLMRLPYRDLNWGVGVCVGGEGWVCFCSYGLVDSLHCEYTKLAKRVDWFQLSPSGAVSSLKSIIIPIAAGHSPRPPVPWGLLQLLFSGVWSWGWGGAGERTMAASMNSSPG